ncbi:hypothetical protein AYI68_g972 [Smittium mucronatum]|uniref:Hexosyltransferase n=1 Tax=Smittium mucronatum TaxID=133383 RepID=A0A1R0H6Q3_9FUNG|nr:hypothetical protein AYI68_g972 [Smittium mucronatum]
MKNLASNVPKRVKGIVILLIALVLLFQLASYISLLSRPSTATKELTLHSTSGAKRNPLNSVSWHMGLESFNRIKRVDKDKKVDYVCLPKEYYGPGQLTDLGQDYLIMVPLSKVENIVFLRNFYSDLNLVVICDADDNREGCDYHLKGNYEYGTLGQKTFDLFDFACKNFPGYKLYAKMDFDAYLDKNYVHGVLKFMMDNIDKRIYYGNPYMKHEHMIVFMGGNFYALNAPLMADYCSCKIPDPDMFFEDEWYGHVLTNCTRSIKDGKDHEIHYMYNNMDKILHKEYKAQGVHVKLGRNIQHK